MSGEGVRPDLSVVVALISGRIEHLRSCLAALRDQEAPPPFEILVPFDAPVSGVAELAEEYPEVRFISAGKLNTTMARAGASREHHDSLRTIGLKNATGRIIALTEDHARVSSTWCADMVRLLDENPRAACVGGAVECESESLLNWAVYYCDFGRYQNPLSEGPAAYISDSNVGYRREALEAIRIAWEDDYHETTVHWTLAEKGYQLLLTPSSTVWQARGRLLLKDCLRERYVWGRSFAGTRAKGMTTASRLAYVVLSGALPFVLSARVAARGLRRRRSRRKLLGALPLILLLESVWATGELIGYLTGKPV